jgi:transcription-repair coupling factor (superfamily II helicase)
MDLLFANRELTSGDAVVHLDHGLARYDGEEVVEIDGDRQELIKLTYRNGGKLMLPAEQRGNLWPYGSRAEILRLDRLNHGDWVANRDRLISEIKVSKQSLAMEANERLSARVSSLKPDRDLLETFSKAFPHEETEDQLRVIGEVKCDLASDIPMDRLIVGDVGFGKTEVVLRAAAIAVFSGAQAVIAAPTTVLARQPFEDGSSHSA